MDESRDRALPPLGPSHSVCSILKHAAAFGALGPPAAYKASLPMMTPMTKKRTQNASTRVVSPSSLKAVPDAEPETGGDIDVVFLLLSPSSS